MAVLNWGLIQDGGTFESLMHAILYAEDSGIILFGRPGKDAGQDARTADGTVIYQAKYRQGLVMEGAVALALEELEKIKRYRQPEHRNCKHWGSARLWILVANFSTNSNDDAKWRRKVVPAFQREGLDAYYWHIETLEGKLAEHPEVCDVFFGGENRVLVGLKEAYALLSAECVGSASLDVPLVGRDNDLSQIKAFAVSYDKRVLPVVGPGGIGKSRLLYEGLVSLAQDGWRVFWGLPGAMVRSSQWFRLLNGNQKTCVVLDDPDDPGLLRAVIEQLATVERRNWKVIIALCTEKTDMLLRFSSNSNVADSLTLAPLNETSTKELLSSILDSNVKESYLHRVYSYTRGSPGWLCLVAEVVGQKSLKNSQPKIDQIAGLYVASCIEKLLPEQQNKGRTLLRWFALWGTIDFDNENNAQRIIDFIEEQDIQESLVRQLLANFVDAGIVNNWGVRKRFFAVQPMLIREHILVDWLLEKTNGKYQVNAEGERLVRFLVSGKIPAVDMVYKSLSHLAHSRLEDSRSYSFLQPLFDVMAKIAKDGNVIKQQKLLELIAKLGPADSERALEVLKTIRENPKENMEIDVPLWGKTIFSHAKVTAKLPWALFQLVEFVPDETVAGRCLDEFQGLLVNLQASSEPSESGKGVRELLERLLCGSRNSAVFARPASVIVKAELEKEELSPFVEILLKCLLNPEREYTEWIANWKLSFVRSPIVPDGDEWNISRNIREEIFRLLQKTTEQDIRCQLWSILSESHRQFHFMMLHGYMKNDMKGRFLAVLIDDLKTCTDILRSPSVPLTIEEATHIRKTWEWYLEYDKDTELLRLSKDCEKFYNSISKWRVHDFFRFATEEELALETERVVKKLREAIDASVYKEFFDEAIRYLNAARQGQQDTAGDKRIYELANVCADLLSLDKSTHPNALTVFVTQFLAEPKQENLLARTFVVRVCQKYLLCIKKSGNVDLSVELSRLMDITASKDRLLWELYSNVHPVLTGMLTDTELDYILKQERVFSGRKWFVLLGAFSAVAWDRVEPRLRDRLSSLGDDVVEASQYMICFIQSVYLTALRYDWSSAQLRVAWTIDIITKFQLDGAILAMHDLGWLRDKAGFRLSVSQLLALIDRNDLEQPKPYDRFEILPHGFKVGEWCNFDTSNPVEVAAFHHLCSLALGRSFTAIYWLPKYLAQIDPPGHYVETFVTKHLSNNPSIDESALARLGYLVSAYPEDSKAWASIASPICEKAQKMSRKDREHVYFGLELKETRVMINMPGGVSNEYRDALDTAKRLFDSEPSESPLKPYRKWALDRAEAELLREQQRVEEDND